MAAGELDRTSKRTADEREKRRRIMKSRKLWIILAVIALAGVAYGVTGKGSGEGIGYRFVAVERGTVEEVVTSTGTMQPTETVEVGTQVSGLLAAVYVDFNDRVKEGDLLAQIDPTILRQEVRSAEASVARSEAELNQARRDLARITELFEAKISTASDIETAQYQFDVVEASYKQAQISLERAERNLEYTVIRAPVDGVVIERAVDAGQTVAASMSAPVLFVIARDLSEMEILASVDESEIGLIHQGQEVEFTVQAYPEKTFQGRVSQVRLQSTVVENVVTYGVVISVDNSDGSLLPGMTATVEFIVAKAEDVLKVSNTALRFQPTQAMREELAAAREKSVATAGVLQAAQAVAPTGEGSVVRGGAAGGSEGSATGSIDTGARSAGSESSFLYFLDRNGRLAATRVETGITDRQSTVVSSPELFEGMQVIAAVGSSSVAASAGTAASNPFQSQSGARRPGPPMM
jgi:HlyD family secretion protein